MTWTTEKPNAPGWYFLRYTGYKSGRKMLTVALLDMKPANLNWLTDAPCLAFVDDAGDGTRGFRPIHFHPDCEPVEWSSTPIPAPTEGENNAR